MKTVAFFNNKGGVGKTSLVYHLAWMYADLGLNVVAADLDPQANLTGMFLDEGRVETLWAEKGERKTVYGSLTPLLEGTGDIAPPSVFRRRRGRRERGESAGDFVLSSVFGSWRGRRGRGKDADDIAPPDVLEAAPGVSLLVGDLALSSAEEELSAQWPQCLDRKPRAFRVLSALWRILDAAAERCAAPLVLVDVGPNLGALNRAALVAADYVVVPLAPDLYSLQGLKNLGPTLSRWRSEWRDRRERNPVADLRVSKGTMEPIGYVVLQHAERLDRPVQAYARWMDRIPGVYRRAIAGETTPDGAAMGEDENCLATLKHFRSLMPLAQDARKPMFFLKAGDGARGGHMKNVKKCYDDFAQLARIIAERCGVSLP